MKGNGKAGKGPASQGEASMLPHLGLGPDSVLMNDPKLFVDGRFLASLIRELESELGIEGAAAALFEVGAVHGLRDAERLLGGPWIDEGLRSPLPRSSATALKMDLAVPRIDADRIELQGGWPDCHEAQARLSRLGPATRPSCWLSAGYTAGWLSATHETDVLVQEVACAAAGADACSFHVLDRASFAARYGESACRPIPYAAPAPAPPAPPTQGRSPRPAPSCEMSESDGDAVHVWGPVMVLPVHDADEGLRTVQMLERDPSLSQVRVVIVDLRGRILSDELEAVALEQLLGTIGSWGAEAILAGVAPLSEPLVADLAAAHLVTRKDLPDAIATAFQIAEAQRHVL